MQEPVLRSFGYTKRGSPRCCPGRQAVFGHIQRRSVIEVMARLFQPEWVWVDLRRATLRFLCQDSGFGRFQDAIELSETYERLSDSAIFRLLVITSEQLSDRPDERRKVLLTHTRISAGMA